MNSNEVDYVLYYVKCESFSNLRRTPDIERASENKDSKTHAVVRENVGLLSDIVARLTSMAQDVTHNINGSDGQSLLDE